MTKKFVIKPWVIIIISVVVIGGVTAFLVLNKGKESPKASSSSDDAGKRQFIGATPEQLKKYDEEVAQTRAEAEAREKKVEEAIAERKAAIKSGDKDEIEKANKAINTARETARAAREKVPTDESALYKTGKKGGKHRHLTVDALKKQRRSSLKTRKQQGMLGIPHCAKPGKKGDKHCGGYRMPKNGCLECEAGYFSDEDGKCHGRGSGECNHPYLLADESGKILGHEDNQKGACCVCASLNTEDGFKYTETVTGDCKKTGDKVTMKELQDLVKANKYDVGLLKTANIYEEKKGTSKSSIAKPRQVAKKKTSTKITKPAKYNPRAGKDLAKEDVKKLVKQSSIAKTEQQKVSEETLKSIAKEKLKDKFTIQPDCVF